MVFQPRSQDHPLPRASHSALNPHKSPIDLPRIRHEAPLRTPRYMLKTTIKQHELKNQIRSDLCGKNPPSFSVSRHPKLYRYLAPLKAPAKQHAFTQSHLICLGPRYSAPHSVHSRRNHENHHGYRDACSITNYCVCSNQEDFYIS